ncbi:unnamed protein product [Ambrosiozyma monospora]|uniref:Unnamed protein product n=1 Tax=Ambrosiozyma monospora TaxID=43982 RepID=A0A9W6Z2P2_AMBMO|nr:unnamed protein product [Ambrosiozyma monospora]
MPNNHDNHSSYPSTPPNTSNSPSNSNSNSNSTYTSESPIIQLTNIDINLFPNSLKPCRSTFQLFKKCLIQAINDQNLKLFILTYILGLQLVRNLMDLYDRQQQQQEQEQHHHSANDYGKDTLLNLLNLLISSLEQIKTEDGINLNETRNSKNSKKLFKFSNLLTSKSKSNSKSNSNSSSPCPQLSLVDIVNDEEKSRLFLNQWCLEKINEIETIFEKAMIDKTTVELLVDCSVGLQVSLALSPTNEIEVEVDVVEEHDHDDKEKELNDLQSEVNKEEHGTNTDMRLVKDDTHLTNNKEKTTESDHKEESTFEKENSDEIDIKQEFNYFQSELQKAEDEISKPLLTQIEDENGNGNGNEIEIDGQDNYNPEVNKKNTKDIKDKGKEIPLIMTKIEIQDKINWCNYQIRRIIDCFKTGENPNDGLLSSLYLNHGPSKMEPISQDEIQKVIKEALTMDSDSDSDYGNAGDEDEFREEDYYYDSDEGEFIKKGHKSGIDDMFPVVPNDQRGLKFERNNDTTKTKSSNTVDTVGASVDNKTDATLIPKPKPKPKPKPNPTDRSRSTPKIPTVADLIAQKSSTTTSTNPNPVQVSKPMDLETLEKQMENSELLNSASKCCKFAISSINYEDVDTALNELQEAVKLLELYKGKMEGML